MRILQLCIAAFASFIDIVGFGTELQRQVFRIIHVVRLHQFLLLGRPGLAGGKRLLEHWRRRRSDRSPFVELLTEEIGFEAQEDLRTLDLPKIEALGCHFFRIGHHWIDIRPYEVSKRLCGGNDFFEYLLFLRLKGQVRDLSLPVLKVFKLRTSCITGDLDTIIAYRAGVIVIFFHLATGNLEALAVVPIEQSADSHLFGHCFAHHS